MRFFTKEVKIALTAIVAIALLYSLINFMKGVNIFKSSNTYYVEFENIQGLTVSNSVYANGYPVGIVRSIEYDYDRTNKVVVAVELDKEMRVPKGTKAELETSLMGGVTMNLILGPNPTQYIERGDTLKGGPHEGAMAQVEQSVPQMVALIPKIDSILTNFTRLTSDPALQQMLHNAAAISENLRTTSAQLDKMMGRDVPQMMAKLNQASTNLNKLSENLAGVDVQSTMQQVNSALNEVEGFSRNINNLSGQLNTRLNSKDNSLGLLMNDRGLYDNLNRTFQNADSLVTDLKAHPKRYVHFSVFGKKSK